VDRKSERTRGRGRGQDPGNAGGDASAGAVSPAVQRRPAGGHEKKKGRRRKKVESEEARLPSDLLKSRLLDLRRRRHQLWRLQYGYDIRVADDFRIFTNVNSTIVDPKHFDSRSLVEFKGPCA